MNTVCADLKEKMPGGCRESNVSGLTSELSDQSAECKQMFETAAFAEDMLPLTKNWHLG